MVTRLQVLGFRIRAQQLDLAANSVAKATVLDLGVQDTGPDGALWALAIRGLDVSALGRDELARVWTIRGAPHLYRRRDLPAVAAAVAPFSEADAGKRIFDASKPLKAADISNLAALGVVATAMRSIVTEPTGKGEVSSRLAGVMDKPYLRFCRVCDATHLYEMPFRLAALRAGLELEADTSPPVLRRIPDFEPVDHVPKRYDVVRGYLQLLGPATPRAVADYLDAPLNDVRTQWPKDAVEVTVAGEKRWIRASDEGGLDAGRAKVTRLLGPFDLFLQARDRSLIVPDPDRAKALWPRLGRPGAVLLDGDIAGTWRPRKSGRKLEVRVELWSRTSAAARERIAEQAERLAGHRGVELSRVDFVS